MHSFGLKGLNFSILFREQLREIENCDEFTRSHDELIIHKPLTIAQRQQVLDLIETYDEASIVQAKDQALAERATKVAALKELDLTSTSTEELKNVLKDVISILGS